ncbi:mitochondrial carrier domain-containing protein [Xylaria intraflava]|nr:mitochondrial carrier domain-containing protein [Xylaria intraflava]
MTLRSIWTRLKQKRAHFGRFGYYMFMFAASVPVVISFNTFILELAWIRGASMYPFLNPDKDQTTREDVVVNFKYNAQYALQRGMIVTFWNPLRPEAMTVKRVVGLPGDVIRTRNPYPVRTVIIPPGHVWVEGDGGERDSLDSNNYGPIATGLIIATVSHLSSSRPRWIRKMTISNGDTEGRPPYLYSMFAGGLGGTTGDVLMHSLDTVKTRQQGDPHVPPKYTTLRSSYYTIWRQEGIRRGLYGGLLPAVMGSFPGTMLFFGSYEWSKRHMLDFGIQAHVSYLTAGFIGDLAASIVYVPSEVLKTRLQLQGRVNNPYFKSGYNYKGTFDAARTIIRTEGFAELFSGYKATLYRDIPFSALQFMFYEQFQIWAREWKDSRDIGVRLEILTGAAGGGLAGVMTCPLDVVKTRLQTQIDPAPGLHKPKDRAATDTKSIIKEAGKQTISTSQPNSQIRPISTSSPSTSVPRPGAIALDEESIIKGLRLIYKTEGFGGWFRGVGPRFLWTSVQSGCMFFLYQTVLRQLETWIPVERQEMSK